MNHKKCMCGGIINFNTSIKLLSHPAQYKGVCTECSAITYIRCIDLDMAYPITATRPPEHIDINVIVEPPKPQKNTMVVPDDFRLYSVTNMYTIGIHAGIQTQHSTVELFTKYRSVKTESQLETIYHWAENHKTTVVVNGGMHEHLVNLLSELENTSLIYAPFFEPGLNNACTSISLILSSTEYMFSKVEAAIQNDEYIDQDTFIQHTEYARLCPENIEVLRKINSMNLAK